MLGIKYTCRNVTIQERSILPEWLSWSRRDWWSHWPGRSTGRWGTATFFKWTRALGNEVDIDAHAAPGAVGRGIAGALLLWSARITLVGKLAAGSDYHGCRGLREAGESAARSPAPWTLEAQSIIVANDILLPLGEFGR